MQTIGATLLGIKRCSLAQRKVIKSFSDHNGYARSYAAAPPATGQRRQVKLHEYASRLLA